MKMKKFWLGAAVVFGFAVIGSAISDDDSSNSSDTKPAVVQEEKPEAKPEPKKEAPKKEKKKEDILETTKAKEQIVRSIIQASFPDYDVKFDKASKTYTMAKEDEEFGAAITMVMIGQTDPQLWYNMVDAFADMSKQIRVDVGKGYSIALCNPINIDNVILIVKDGNVEYDAIKEKIDSGGL